MTITTTLKVTAVMAVLTFATFFMASGFSSLTMGSYPISDVFAQGGKNTANQDISQSNTASTSAQCAAGTLKGPACNSTTNQGNSNSGSNTAGQTAGGGTGMSASTQSKHFDAKLSGKNEVPPKDTTATGTATFNVIGTDSITYTVHVKDMQMVTAAHIHQGNAGENGPVLVTLYNNPTPSAMTNGELAKGTITATNLEGPLAGKQGISQSNTASTSAQCAAGTLKGPACNSTTNQGNSNSGSNTAGQVAGGSGTQ